MRPQEASEEAEETTAGVSEVIAIAMCVCSLSFSFPAATGQALDWGGVEREAGRRQKLYVSLTESLGLVFPEWGQRRRMEKRFLHWQTMIRDCESLESVWYGETSYYVPGTIHRNERWDIIIYIIMKLMASWLLANNF